MGARSTWRPTGTGYSSLNRWNLARGSPRAAGPQLCRTQPVLTGTSAPRLLRLSRKLVHQRGVQAKMASTSSERAARRSGRGRPENHHLDACAIIATVGLVTHGARLTANGGRQEPGTVP